MYSHNISSRNCKYENLWHGFFTMRFHDMSSLKSYEVIQKLGQGTFGVVQKARNRKTNELVALKQLINHLAKEGFPITAMREITILRTLDHTNVLKIVDMIYDPPKVQNPQDVVHTRGCFYTVSPYMSSDLVGLLENPNISLDVPQIKCLMKQLLHGIHYIHSQNYLHRDVKAANILIDSEGVLKIADFGLARSYHGQPPKLGQGPGGGERNYTALVVTRWYRPPELLLGERKYTTAVDMWGVGCVFGELFLHRPILAGQSDTQQAQIIFDLCGPPNPINWQSAHLLPNKTELNVGLRSKRTLEQRFLRFMTSDGLELLLGLLTLDPYKRMNALDALAHPYFQNEPRALEPGELPKYEESHEIDKDRFKKLRKEAPRPEDMFKDKLRGLPAREAPVSRPKPAPPAPAPTTKEPRERDTYIPKPREAAPPSSDRRRDRYEPPSAQASQSLQPSQALQQAPPLGPGQRRYDYKPRSDARGVFMPKRQPRLPSRPDVKRQRLDYDEKSDK